MKNIGILEHIYINIIDTLTYRNKFDQKLSKNYTLHSENVS